MKTTIEPVTTVQLITPEWAKEKLDILAKQQESNGFRQRPPRERAIQRYTQDMKRGKWQLTHQGIAFDEHDHLIDGQNRLWAIWRAGIPIKLNVTTNVPATQNPIDVIDSGSPRTIWQNLQLIHGYGKLACEAQALARGVSHLVLQSKPETEKRNSFQISFNEALFLLEEIGLVTSLERLFVLVPMRSARRSFFSAPWALYHLRYPQKAEEFANAYSTLENQKKGSPPLLLNRYFSVPRVPKDYVTKASITANALYSFNNGIQLEQLRVSKEALQWLIDLNPKKCTAIFERLTQ